MSIFLQEFRLFLGIDYETKTIESVGLQFILWNIDLTIILVILKALRT